MRRILPGLGMATGAVVAAISRCRSNMVLVGLFFVVMGCLYVVGGRGGLSNRTPMVRAQMHVWRGTGQFTIALGIGLAATSALVYVVAGPGRCA